MNQKLVDKVKNRIDSYIKFGSDDLFKNGDLKIFGGAVRDSIADMPIHDVDIICGAVTSKRIHSFLESKGFTYMKDLTPKDLSRVYSDLKCINEPWTYVKNDIIIQVIRPTGNNNMTPKDTKRHIDYLIENVDISCCGVSYDGQSIKEAHENSIIHCLCKICCTNPSAIMSHPNRLLLRKHKLMDRGWEFFVTHEEEHQLIRERNIGKLLNN